MQERRDPLGDAEQGRVDINIIMIICTTLPQTDVKVEQIWSDDIEVTAVTSGENIKIKIKGIDDSDVSPGFVLCSSVKPITTGKVFDAQVS